MVFAFAFQGLHCERIGQITDSARLNVSLGAAQAEFWNLDAQPFTGFSHAPISTQEEH